MTSEIRVCLARDRGRSVDELVTADGYHALLSVGDECLRVHLAGWVAGAPTVVDPWTGHLRVLGEHGDPAASIHRDAHCSDGDCWGWGSEAPVVGRIPAAAGLQLELDVTYKPGPEQRSEIETFEVVAWQVRADGRFEPVVHGPYVDRLCAVPLGWLTDEIKESRVPGFATEMRLRPQAPGGPE
jgi:hypothetical protein